MNSIHNTIDFKMKFRFYNKVSTEETSIIDSPERERERERENVRNVGGKGVKGFKFLH
jgi:hypothetical protein